MGKIGDKRGIVLGNVFVFLIMSFVFIIILGTLLYVFGIIDAELSGGNIISGDINISNYSANTVGKINSAFLGNADIIGILFLFGIIIAMVINGFLTREEHPPLFFRIDFLIILFGYILAVYISNAYETVLNTLPFSDIIIANLSGSSRFMLLLPKITVVVCALTLIVTYAGIPKSKEESVGGF